MRSCACWSPRRSTAPGPSRRTIRTTANKVPTSLDSLPPRARLTARRPAGEDSTSSTSRRRARAGASCSTQIGVRHELLLAGADEDVEALEASAPANRPPRYVERVTRAKLRAARRRARRARAAPAPILCADTTVALGRAHPRQAADAADAAACWRCCRAAPIASSAPSRSPARRTRRLASASRASASRRSRRTRIERYVASGEPFGKAGAYAIQSGAAAWIERIEGSYTGIMGLPLHETAALLELGGRRRPALTPDPSSPLPPHDARHPDQLGAAGNARRRRRERRGPGAAYRARARARPGRQHLHRQGRARAARHAVGLHRHRPRARRLPAHRRRLRQRRHVARRPLARRRCRRRRSSGSSSRARRSPCR